MRAALETGTLRSIYDRVAHRYDFQHKSLTAGADQRGRELVVQKAVHVGGSVLDCGGGTGSTALLAARRVGPSGKVMLFDLSKGMLDVARKRAAAANLLDRLEFCAGDILSLPFANATYDSVLSTYSMCPLYDPAKGALELYRVLKPGGHLGIAHSTDPQRAWVKWLADGVERLVWHFPSISLGCRSVSVVSELEGCGGRIVFTKHIGVPLWPFLVLIVEKPAT